MKSCQWYDDGDDDGDTDVVGMLFNNNSYYLLFST